LKKGGARCKHRPPPKMTHQQDLTKSPKNKVSIDWKRFLPAPLWGFIVAIPFLIWMPNAATQLPTFVTTNLTDVGALVTPLSLIYIGIMLKDFGLQSVRFSKNLNVAILGRFVLSPIIMFTLIYAGAHGLHVNMASMFSKTLSSRPPRHHLPFCQSWPTNTTATSSLRPAWWWPLHVCS
ncbi:hypothetical protein PPJ99_02660, partial [Limosilactobacillus fermentum]|nr:hypothetical protein [Limosilactobacillus fermentum]